MTPRTQAPGDGAVLVSQSESYDVWNDAAGGEYWMLAAPDGPVFEIRAGDNKVYRVWANGRTEGFGEGVTVINRIPRSQKARYQLLREAHLVAVGIEFKCREGDILRHAVEVPDALAQAMSDAEVIAWAKPKLDTWARARVDALTKGS